MLPVSRVYEHIPGRVAVRVRHPLQRILPLLPHRLRRPILLAPAAALDFIRVARSVQLLACPRDQRLLLRDAPRVPRTPVSEEDRGQNLRR